LRSRHLRRGSLTLAGALVLAAPLVALAAPRQASTAPAFTFTATASEPGWIAFRVAGAGGASVKIDETVGGVSTPVVHFAIPAGSGGRHHGAPWRCDRSRRTFVATETLPSAGAPPQTATATVVTPACNAQLTMSTWPQPPRVGTPLDVTLSTARAADRRTVRLCARQRSVRVCHTATLAATPTQATLVLRRPGVWTLSATGRGIAIERTLHAARRPLTVLATGDSEMQILDDDIATALGARAHVFGEAHISTGLSKLAMFDWLTRAQTQAQTIHPDITIMAIGANDGFDIPGAGGASQACCGQGWIDAYAARAEQMMRSYLRTGAGRVYWFLLPTPGRADFVRVYRAVDAGFLEAAAHFPSGVHVVDIRPIFSPGGTYRQFVGPVNARESDRIHLSAAGDQIALRFLLAQMRADGTL
jgi:lysophospholipase L1-like esterase